MSSTDNRPTNLDLEARIPLSQVVRLAQVSPSTVQRQTKSGALRATKVGRCTRYRVADVLAWLNGPEAR